MYCINDVIGWIGNIAVINCNGGYVLVDWFDSGKRLEIKEDV